MSTSANSATSIRSQIARIAIVSTIASTALVAGLLYLQLSHAILGTIIGVVVVAALIISRVDRDSKYNIFQ